MRHLFSVFVGVRGCFSVWRVLRFTSVSSLTSPHPFALLPSPMPQATVLDVPSSPPPVTGPAAATVVALAPTIDSATSATAVSADADVQPETSEDVQPEISADVQPENKDGEDNNTGGGSNPDVAHGDDRSSETGSNLDADVPAFDFGDISTGDSHTPIGGDPHGSDRLPQRVERFFSLQDGNGAELLLTVALGQLTSPELQLRARRLCRLRRPWTLRDLRREGIANAEQVLGLEPWQPSQQSGADDGGAAGAQVRC